jgi:signal transduction histidine kinase
MLKKLRWQLTALYLLAAVGLVVLIGAGSYALLKYYYQYETDQALDYKMALLFNTYALNLPPELVKAQENWQNESLRQVVYTPTKIPQLAATSRSGAESEEDGESHEAESHESDLHEAYDGSLAPIFVLTQGGNPAASQLTFSPAPIVSDVGALNAALQTGSDRRTLRLADGSLVRLLTYRTHGSGDIPPALQIGRLLDDQARILQQYLTGLLVLGSLAILALGAGSWWLSGRSISPAQQAWDQQQTFVSNASHELRTPLTLIRATAEYGLRQNPGAEQAQILNDILQEEDYMNRLVDDLLLLSRLDTHRLELARQTIQLSELLTETSRQVEKIAASKGVEIKLGKNQGSVWGDPKRLRQVLLILLDNALRFTPSGGVIRLETLAQGKLCGVSVQDNGAGIPAQDLPHVFDRFYQAPRPGGDDSRNNGLGLSIAKSLVEAQGGSIAISSQEGKGTSVSLWLPASNVAP